MNPGDIRHWPAAGLVRVITVGDPLTIVEVIASSGTTRPLHGQRYHLTSRAVAAMRDLTAVTPHDQAAPLARER